MYGFLTVARGDERHSLNTFHALDALDALFYSLLTLTSIPLLVANSLLI